MSQPNWKLVYSTDHSALYTDETGAYAPELAIAQDLENGLVYVHRFPCERLSLATIALDPVEESVALDADEQGDHDRAHAIRLNTEHVTKLVDADMRARQRELPQPLHKYGVWFAQDLADIVRTYDHENIVEDLQSDDPATLASAYESIGQYQGFMNLDHEPDVWTAHEFESWPECGPAIDADEFIQGYVECALWCGVVSPSEDASDSIKNLDESLLTDAARAEMEKDCRDFCAAQNDLLREYLVLGRDAEAAGHDFWLTRNGHGAGFWDRGIGDVGNRLSNASKVYGSQNLYAEWDPLDCTTEDEKHEDFVPHDDRDVIAIHVGG